MLEPFAEAAAAFEQASRAPVRVAIFTSLEAQGKALGEKLAAYWNCELIEPSVVLQSAVKDAKATVKQRAKEAARARKAEKKGGGGTDEDEDNTDEEEDKKYGDEEAEEGEADGQGDNDGFINNTTFGSMIELDDEGIPEDEEPDEDKQRRENLYIFKPRPLEHATEKAIEILETLVHGKSVSSQQVLDLMTERAASERAQFKGYITVMDTSTGSSAHDLCRQMAQWTYKPDVVFVLQESSADIGAQIKTQCQDFHNGHIVALPITKAVLPPETAQENSDEEGDDADEEDVGWNDEPEEDDSQAELALKTPTDKSMPPAPDVTAQFIEQRCVRRPEDIAVQTQSRSSPISKLKELVATVKPTHVIQLDGTAALHSTVNAITSFLHEQQYVPVIDPLPLENENTEFSSDAEMFEVLGTQGLHGNEGDGDEESELSSWTWQPGPFGPYCPVAIHDGILKQGDAAFAVVFQGRLYLLSDAHARKAFLTNPRRFVRRPSNAPCRIIFVGFEEPKLVLLANAFLAHHPQGNDIGTFNLDDLLPAADASEQAVKDALAEMVDALSKQKSWVAYTNITKVSMSVYRLLGTAAAPHAVLVMQPPPRPAVPEITVPGSDSEGETQVAIKKVTAPDPRMEAAERVVSALHDKGAVASIISHLSYADTVDEVHPNLLARINFYINMMFKMAPRESSHDLEASNLHYGDAGRYCPVMLEEKRLLVPGAPEFAVRYCGRFYHFSDEASRSKFQLAPYRYVSTTEPLTPPPPRLSFIGPAGSGKSMYAQQLGQARKLHVVDFPSLIKEAAENAAHDLHEIAKNHALNPEESDFPADSAVKLIEPLWTTLPFSEEGFILEGFPRNDEDLRLAIQSQLYFDTIVNFTLSNHVASRRLLPKALDEYKTQRDDILKQREEARRQKQEEQAKRHEAFRLAQEAKREQFEADLQQRIDAGEDVEDEQFVADAYETEDEQEPEEEQELENDEEARERISQQLVDVHERVAEAAQAALDAGRDEYRLIAHNINANYGPSRIYALLRRLLKPLLEDRDAVFDYTFAPSLRHAEELLEKGPCSLSVFGTWDPVDVFHGKAAMTTLSERYALVYRSRVYYFSSLKNREEFQLRPRRYLAKHPTVLSPLLPATQLILFVVGPPKIGKTTLCQRLAQHYSIPILSGSTVLEDLLLRAPQSDLAKRARTVLTQGLPLPEDLVCAAMQQAFMRPDTIARGFVMDLNQIAVETLREWIQSGLSTFVVIELKATEAVCLARNARERSGPLRPIPVHDSDTVVSARYASYSATIAEPRQICIEEYRNWYEVSGSHNKWGQFAAARAVCDSVLQAQGRLQWTQRLGLPSPLHRTCTPADTLQPRLSKFKLLCPVRWVDHMELVKTPIDRLQYCLLFQNNVYYCAGQPEFEKFITNTQKYINADPPLSLPEIVDEASIKLFFPQKMSFSGFCPVSYANGNEQPEAMTPGLAQFVVRFEDHYYAMATQKARDQFMMTPHRYAALSPPEKIPRHVAPVNVASLPMLAYMEYSVAQTITKALTAVGLKRPKFPFLTAKQSAIAYFATYLKAHNQGASDFSRRKWQQKLRMFEEKATLLLELAKAAQIDYDAERPIDFERKLETFFNLQGTIIAGTTSS
eukprot:m.142673 g.142673  ORF g.142673 m.142673 type:complete len:1621 (-) comp16001_c0_seq1:119-4981(-)